MGCIGLAWLHGPEVSNREDNSILTSIFYEPTKELLSLAFWKTISSDSSFNKETRETSRIIAECTEAEAYLYGIDRSEDRKLIATKLGMIGLAPEDVRIGDNLCVIRGLNMPFVIRKREQGDWTLVGACYVHGAMDGQVVANRRHQDTHGNLLWEIIGLV
jgi:hypothetical protein